MSRPTVTDVNEINIAQKQALNVLERAARSGQCWITPKAFNMNGSVFASLVSIGIARRRHAGPRRVVQFALAEKTGKKSAKRW